jgi:hypothetical protein
MGEADRLGLVPNEALSLVGSNPSPTNPRIRLVLCYPEGGPGWDLESDRSHAYAMGVLVIATPVLVQSAKQ